MPVRRLVGSFLWHNVFRGVFSFCPEYVWVHICGPCPKLATFLVVARLLKKSGPRFFTAVHFCDREASCRYSADRLLKLVDQSVRENSRGLSYSLVHPRRGEAIQVLDRVRRHLSFRPSLTRFSYGTDQVEWLQFDVRPGIYSVYRLRFMDVPFQCRRIVPERLFFV